MKKLMKEEITKLLNIFCGDMLLRNCVFEDETKKSEKPLYLQLLAEIFYINRSLEVQFFYFLKRVKTPRVIQKLEEIRGKHGY